MSWKRKLALGLVLAAAFSCRPDDQRTETVDPRQAQQERENLPSELVAQLDSGSAAYREQEFQAALDHYTTAAEMDDEVAAAWFGVYMAHHAMGNGDEAEEALERAQQVAPGATLIHPPDEDGQE